MLPNVRRHTHHARLLRAPRPALTSIDAARAIAEREPAVTGGVFATEVFPFQPMLMGAWPAEAATVPPAA